MRALELSKVDSERIGGGLRGGWSIYMETWNHPSGLTIYAYDMEYYGPIPVRRPTNRDFTAQNNVVTVEGIPTTPKPPARHSFVQVLIKAKSGRELFRSDRTNHGHVE